MACGRALIGIGLAATLAGCATQGRAGGGDAVSIGPGVERRVAAHFNLDTPVGQICDDPQGRAVLDLDMPDLRKNPNYFLFKTMSLRQLASLSGGKISDAKLETVRGHLAAMPAGGAR